MKHDEDHDNLNTTVKIPVCYKSLNVVGIHYNNTAGYMYFQHALCPIILYIFWQKKKNLQASSLT